MAIRYLENTDLKASAVAALRQAVGWDGREEKLKETLGKTYLHVAAFEEERLIGFVDVISDGVDDALIRNLLVHPDYQRSGVALSLLELVVRRVRADRIKTVNVLFKSELKKLYQQAGFTIICGGLIDNEVEGF